MASQHDGAHAAVPVCCHIAPSTCDPQASGAQQRPIDPDASGLCQLKRSTKDPSSAEQVTSRVEGGGRSYLLVGKHKH